MASSSRSLFRVHIAGALLLLLAACSQRTEDVALGYVEADYVRLSSPLAGQLAKLYLQRGQQVAAGAAAFTLEQESERAGQEESRHRVEQARRQLADLQAGRRPDEIRALQAQLDQARAALAASTADLDRTQRLVRDQFVSPSRLDEQRAVVQRDRARVDELAANLRQGRQGARENQVAAAQQELEAAEAQAEQAEWRVEQKTRTVPVAGVVFDVLFREGEWLPAGSPVITLLPPGNIKARFFVSQSVAGGLRLGQPVQLSCDGCGAPVSARISFLSPETEYTAPVIYSRDQRDKLVVMAEARPDDPKRPPLRVGQPLEVRFGAPPAP